MIFIIFRVNKLQTFLERFTVRVFHDGLHETLPIAVSDAGVHTGSPHQGPENLHLVEIKQDKTYRTVRESLLVVLEVQAPDQLPELRVGVLPELQRFRREQRTRETYMTSCTRLLPSPSVILVSTSGTSPPCWSCCWCCCFSFGI